MEICGVDEVGSMDQANKGEGGHKGIEENATHIGWYKGP